MNMQIYDEIQEQWLMKNIMQAIDHGFHAEQGINWILFVYFNLPARIAGISWKRVFYC